MKLETEAQMLAKSWASRHWSEKYGYPNDPAVEFDDLLQECYIASWQALPGWDEEQSTLHTYLHRIILPSKIANWESRTLNMFVPRDTEDDVYNPVPTISLDSPVDVDMDEELTLHDVVASDQQSVEDAVLDRQLHEAVEEELSKTLGKEDELLIKMYFGLDGYEEHTHLELSKMFGVSRQAITKRLKNLMLKLSNTDAFLGLKNAEDTSTLS